MKCPCYMDCAARVVAWPGCLGLFQRSEIFVMHAGVWDRLDQGLAAGRQQQNGGQRLPQPPGRRGGDNGFNLALGMDGPEPARYAHPTGYLSLVDWPPSTKELLC